jgi:hypothetical protein
MSEFKEDPWIKHLMDLHYECRYYIENKPFEEFAIFLEGFLKPETDVNELRTILIITNSFKENEIIKEVIKKIEDLETLKLGNYAP